MSLEQHWLALRDQARRGGFGIQRGGQSASPAARRMLASTQRTAAKKIGRSNQQPSAPHGATIQASRLDQLLSDIATRGPAPRVKAFKPGARRSSCPNPKQRTRKETLFEKLKIMLRRPLQGAATRKFRQPQLTIAEKLEAGAATSTGVMSPVQRTIDIPSHAERLGPSTVDDPQQSRPPSLSYTLRSATQQDHAYRS